MINPPKGVSAPVESTATDASESSPESNSTNQITDTMKNVKAEMNRKFSKIDQKIEQLLAALGRSPSIHGQSPVAETDDADAPEYKKYVDARLQEKDQVSVQSAQQESWQKALETFPELNQNSDKFDEKFYQLADKFYADYDVKRVKDAPYRAVREAALELGKIEQLTKEKFLKDEARRSRLIAEGTTASKEQRKEKDPQVNESMLARLGIKADKFKQRLKANKDKYGDL
jgi:hypothetical protein